MSTLLTHALGWLLFGYLLCVVTWFFYVAIMHLKLVRDDLHPVAYWHAMAFLVIGLILDVVLNWLVGSALFLERPREFLLTARLQRHKKGTGWRRAVAAWLCEHLLNQFDRGGHC